MTANTTKSRAWILGLLLAVFGFLCLNYTNGFGLDHHMEWARAHGMPGPTYSIFLVGAALGGLGTGVVGYALGRRERRPG